MKFKSFYEEHNTQLVKYCFVDFDDTIRQATPEGYAPGSVEDVKVFPWAIERLKEAKEKGYFIVGATNQNYYSNLKGPDFVQTIIDETIRQVGFKFPVMFSQSKAQSKPNPWMLERAEKIYGKADKNTSVMVGDNIEKDGGVATNFGIQYVHVNDWKEKGLP